MTKSKNDKIKKYHFEEIVLILLVLASDLSRYDEDIISSFSEDIEGRIEVLFTKDFLSSLSDDFGISEVIILELEKLKNLVIGLYGSQWVKKKLINSNEETTIIKVSASHILDKLKIEKHDPKEFSEKHLNIDW
jgi:hypothetical protein